MSTLRKLFKKTRLSAAIIGAAFVMAPVAAQAATIYASSAEIITDGPRGTTNDRDNINNAFGISDGTFFELGYDAVVEFQFGTPTGELFFGPGSVVEVTNGNADNWLEAVMIEVGIKGDDTSFVTALPNPFYNNSGSNTFTFAGIFDTIRLTDLTPLFGNDAANNAAGGGFDVDSISVSAVPIPAAGFLLLGAFGGLAFMRRRKTA